MSEMSPWARSIGHKIKECRLARNMTQEALANGIFSKSYISQLERGSVTPSLRALQLLAGRLGVSCTWLLESATSPVASLLKAAATLCYLGEFQQARKLLRRVQSAAQAHSAEERTEALLLEARLLAFEGGWDGVLETCNLLEEHWRSSGFHHHRHAVTLHYLCGMAWLRKENLRQAVHHWERGLAALGHGGAPPSHDGLTLMCELSDLYVQLGDLEAANRLHTRARAASTQLHSPRDLSRWVLARRCEWPPGRDDVWTENSSESAADLSDAEAWIRAELLLQTARAVRLTTKGPPSDS